MSSNKAPTSAESIAWRAMEEEVKAAEAALDEENAAKKAADEEEARYEAEDAARKARFAAETARGQHDPSYRPTQIPDWSTKGPSKVPSSSASKNSRPAHAHSSKPPISERDAANKASTQVPTYIPTKAPSYVPTHKPSAPGFKISPSTATNQSASDKSYPSTAGERNTEREGVKKEKKGDETEGKKGCYESEDRPAVEIRERLRFPYPAYSTLVLGKGGQNEKSSEQ